MFERYFIIWFIPIYVICKRHKVPIRFMACSSLKPIETAESIQESGKHDWTWYLDNLDNLDIQKLLKKIVMGDS